MAVILGWVREAIMTNQKKYVLLPLQKKVVEGRMISPFIQNQQL